MRNVSGQATGWLFAKKIRTANFHARENRGFFLFAGSFRIFFIMSAFRYSFIVFHRGKVRFLKTTIIWIGRRFCELFPSNRAQSLIRLTMHCCLYKTNNGKFTKRFRFVKHFSGGVFCWCRNIIKIKFEKQLEYRIQLFLFILYESCCLFCTIPTRYKYDFIDVFTNEFSFRWYNFYFDIILLIHEIE